MSKASEDFPEPLNPVTTVSVLRGISTSMFFRLCCRAPCTVMRSSKSYFPIFTKMGPSKFALKSEAWRNASVDVARVPGNMKRDTRTSDNHLVSASPGGNSGANPLHRAALAPLPDFSAEAGGRTGTVGRKYHDNSTLYLSVRLLTLVPYGYKVEGTVIEQRKNQRFDLKLPFELVRTGAAPKTVGETRNVSSSGVLFSTAVPVEVGEPIEYLITFPKAPDSRAEVRIRCVGKVLRTEIEATFAATLERYEFVRLKA